MKNIDSATNDYQKDSQEPPEEDISVYPSDKVADLVEYIVCGLVEDVSQLTLDVTDSKSGALIEVSCAQEDTGRLIGKKGRTIKAIRVLAKALGQRVGTDIEVEILN